VSCAAGTWVFLAILYIQFSMYEKNKGKTGIGETGKQSKVGPTFTVPVKHNLWGNVSHPYKSPLAATGFAK